MTTTYDFTLVEDERTGSLGWKPDWFADADPCHVGMTLAHDVLEHRKLTPGSVNEEMMALGASLFIRGQGYFDGHHHPHWYTHIASDVVYLSEMQETYGWVVPTLPGFGEQPIYSWAEMAITEMLMTAGLEIGQNEETPPLTIDDQEIMRRLFRVGFRWAHCKYRDAAEAEALFHSIEDQFDELSPVLASLVEGDHLHVTVNLGEMRVNIWVPGMID